MRGAAGALFALSLIACGGGSGPDAGPRPDGWVPPGTDAGPLPDGFVPPGTDAGCIPQIEICGDRMDQNCDGRDTSCGDSDGDGIEACREGDDLTMCDCDDDRADVRPPFGGGLPGAPELCDGVDNDCNGRVDEHAECCAGCSAVEPRSRADICLEDGTCDCSGEAGVGACPADETCCSSGCVNTQTDFDNCGFCQSMCTASADRCVAGNCSCGGGAICDKIIVCSGGSC